MHGMRLPKLLTIKEVANILRLNVRATYDIAQEQRFPVIKLGNGKNPRVRVPLDEFNAWLKQQTRARKG